MRMLFAERLLVDAMFGKLGIYLRLLGYDTEIAGKNLDIADNAIFAQLEQTNQILITRDQGLYDRVIHSTWGQDRVIFLDSKDGEEQLFRVLQKLNVTPQQLEHLNPETMPSRCSACNGLLVPVTKDSIKDQVSPGTWDHIDAYWRCNNPQCSKIFWIGKHWADILALFERVRKRML